MADVRYTPATPATPGEGWRAAVSDGAIAVLAPAVTAQTAEAVWRRLDGGGIGALVEALTGAFGTSLTAIPPFALVVVEEEGVRVAVRGPIELLLEGADSTVSVSGRGVATWAERLLPRAGRVTVSIEGTELDDATSLPISSGVVLAGGVVLSVHSARAAAVVAPPASTAPPAQTPEPADPVAVAGASAVAGDSAVAGHSAVAGTSGDPGAAAADEPAPAPGDGEADGESSGIDTWIPAQTQAPVADALIDDVPLGEMSPSEGATVGPADDSTIAASRGRRAAEATVVRAPVPPPVDAAATTTSVPRGGDHDGATISVAEARALRGTAPHPFEPVADVPPRQPSRGRMRLSTGQVIELERPVVIGRRPRSTRASSAELPTLIAVESPEGDISRSHVEVRAEGEHVLVTDLATTNGTVLRRIGQDPVRLHPNEPTMVVSGDVLDLGDGVTVSFEDLP